MHILSLGSRYIPKDMIKISVHTNWILCNIQYVVVINIG